MEEVLQVTRELIDGVYFSVHVSRDGRMRINTGPDDQRPDHDGHAFFQPICVMEYFVGGTFYTYHHYCGACRKRIGGLGSLERFCPHCGKGIAHYIFAMGTERWDQKDWFQHDIPDIWPVATITPERAALPEASSVCS